VRKPKVFVAKKIPREVEDYIAQYCEYELWSSNENITYDQVLKYGKDVEGLLLSRIKIDDYLLSYAPNLRVVSNMSVGYNNFDIEAMKKRKVIGTNTAGSLDNSVADLIFGLIIASARRITELDRFVKDRRWKKKDDEELYGQDVYQASLGIIGMGRIGECVARRAKFGFDMDVYYYNRNRKMDVEKSLGVTYLDFSTLLNTCDFIVLMTPLTEETYHLIDEEEFNQMNEKAIFINASRGQTVNEKALVDALKNKRILAAGLDVYEDEPISDYNPLLNISNVITLPHIGSSTEKTRAKMAMVAAKNLVQALYGDKPDNIIPELMGY
jgi:gluconate 2-dehydrogenase